MTDHWEESCSPLTPAPEEAFGGEGGRGGGEEGSAVSGLVASGSFCCLVAAPMEKVLKAPPSCLPPACLCVCCLLSASSFSLAWLTGHTHTHMEGIAIGFDIIILSGVGSLLKASTTL